LQLQGLMDVELDQDGWAEGLRAQFPKAGAAQVRTRGFVRPSGSAHAHSGSGGSGGTHAPDVSVSGGGIWQCG
jgi:hypothetical protein